MEGIFISHIKNGIAVFQVQSDGLFTINAVSTCDGRVDWDWAYRVSNCNLFATLGLGNETSYKNTLAGISTITDYFDSYSDEIELKLDGLEVDPGRPFLEFKPRINDNIVLLEQVYFTLVDLEVAELLLEHVRIHLCDQILTVAIADYVVGGGERYEEHPDVHQNMWSFRDVLRRIWLWYKGVDE